MPPTLTAEKKAAIIRYIEVTLPLQMGGPHDVMYPTERVAEPRLLKKFPAGMLSEVCPSFSSAPPTTEASGSRHPNLSILRRNPNKGLLGLGLMLSGFAR